MSIENFRQSVRSGAVLLGTFIKTASHQIPEIIGRAGFDFAIIDAEHAPFSATSLDQMALASRATDFPSLVRVPECAAPPIGQALDIGLAGVLIPHVKDANTANAALAAAKYSHGQRGFSPSTRAANYGKIDPLAYRRAADKQSSVWCQIEDEEALSQLDAITAIEEIDCLFLGRADLAQSLNVDSQNDPKVIEAIAATAQAGRRAGRTVGIYIGDIAEVPKFLELGITVFVCGSDQSLLRAQGARLRSDMTNILSARPNQ